MTLADVLRVTLAELRRQDAAFALVGGLAVSVRTEPRFTRDIDVAVAVVDDREAERRVHDLVTAGFVVDSAVEQTAKGRLATVRLRPPGGETSIVDLLFASSGIEGEVVSRAELLEVLPGLVVPVARTGDLIALKLLARDDEQRPQDAVDLQALVAVADADELALTAAACDAIAARGFDRGRDLGVALAAVMGR